MPRALLFVLITSTAFAQNAPVPAKDAAVEDDAARGLQGHALRRRAGRRPADRLDLRRPRPALGRRVPLVSRSGHDGRGHDRVLIFEDTDGDGHFDKQTVFWDKGANLSGHRRSASAASGSARRRTCSSSRMRTATTSPTVRREVVLDGWDLKAQAQRLQRPDLGPGRLALRLQRHPARTRASASRARPTRTASPINCGVWRYHPTRKTFEVVAHGTTNPWGLDFDDYGEIVHHQLRHQAPLARRPRRPLRAHVRPGLQPAPLRPDEEPAPTTSTGAAASLDRLARRPHRPRRDTPAAATPTPAP